MRRLFSFVAIIILFVIPFTTYSQDRVFAYMYGSSNLNKGMKDLEVWNTFHIGRDYLYRKLESRFEFEIGLSNRLQTSFYLNMKQEFAAPDSIASLSNMELSFSNAWKVKISDAVANALGSSVYAEYYVSPSEFELEGKVILDKRMGNHYIDFNGIYEHEWEWETEKEGGGYESETESESKFECVLGYMYFLKKNWGIGLEMRNHNVMQEGSLNYSALFAGPTVSYTGDKWWLLFNILPQVAKLKSINPDDTWRDLTEHEMVQFRLIFAYNL
jgi:hypothetical protein